MILLLALLLAQEAVPQPEGGGTPTTITSSGSEGYTPPADSQPALRIVGYVECEITDENGKLIAKSNSTCLVLRGDQAAGR